ncbi:hypothetical protein GQ457_13G029120 [Hibiscus cannabinus]
MQKHKATWHEVAADLCHKFCDKTYMKAIKEFNKGAMIDSSKVKAVRKWLVPKNFKYLLGHKLTATSQKKRLNHVVKYRKDRLIVDGDASSEKNEKTFELSHMTAATITQEWVQEIKRCYKDDVLAKNTIIVVLIKVETIANWYFFKGVSEFKNMVFVSSSGNLMGSAMHTLNVSSDAIDALKISNKKMNFLCASIATTRMSSAMLARESGGMVPTYSISTRIVMGKNAEVLLLEEMEHDKRNGYEVESEFLTMVAVMITPTCVHNIEVVTASRLSQDRTMVVACIVAVAQDMGDPIAGYVDRLTLLMLKELALSLATYRMNTAFCAGELAKNGGESAFNYFEESLKILKRHSGYFHEDVRLQAIIALKNILTATHANFQCQNAGLMKAREMLDMVMNIYSKTVTEDGDKVEKVVDFNRVDDSPCCSVIGEYGGTTNMERIIKAQTLKDNNIVDIAAAFLSTIKPNSDVGEAIRRYCIVINSVERLSRFIQTLKWLSLDEKFQQFGIFMMSQVGFAREVTHLINIICNFRRWRDVLFPKHVYPLMHSTVLVETYEQGENVAYFVDDLEGHDRIKVAIDHIETHALLKILLVDSFVHAYMHPKNTLVCVSCSKASRKWLFKSKLLKSHAIFFDIGMTDELSNGNQLNLLKIFKVVGHRDGECRHKLSQQQHCQNLKAFIEEV